MFKQSQPKTKPQSKKAAAFGLLSVAVLIAGCSTNKIPASVFGGSCEIHPKAEFEVRGTTPYDQGWIDETIAVNTEVCKHERPKPRPTTMDPAPRPAPAAKPAKPARRGLLSRLRRQPVAAIPTPAPRPAVAPAAEAPRVVPARAEPVPVEEPAPKTCSGIEELLKLC